MIIDGYDPNPYPFEIGDILREKSEEHNLCILAYANYFHISILFLTGDFANGEEYTHRTFESTEDYERVGHIDAKGVEVLRAWLERKQ